MYVQYDEVAKNLIRSITRKIVAFPFNLNLVYVISKDKSTIAINDKRVIDQLVQTQFNEVYSKGPG